MDLNEAKERLLFMKNQLDECVKRNTEIDDSGIDDDISTVIETILQELERLQKENEELKIKQVMQEHKIDWCEKNTISKDKIREDMDKLSDDLEMMKVDAMYGRYKEYGSKLSFEKTFSYKYGMYDVLQDLLEEE